MFRTFIGLSINSGLEGVDAALVRVGRVGLDLVSSVSKALRVSFPPTIRDSLRSTAPGAILTPPSEFVRNLADTAIHAVRQALTRAGDSPRDTFATGLLEPGHPTIQLLFPWTEVADRLAEQTGITVIHGFRHRDQAAGGSGQPITAAADYLLLRSSTPRLLIHLGAVTSLLYLPAGGKLSATVGFEAGPGNQLLDSLLFHGTRGKESCDPGGKRAVQGRCLDTLLHRWLDHPHLTRVPPKAIHPEAFGRSFLSAAFEWARQLGAALPDLLCTATHLAARAVGIAARNWLPISPGPRQILLTGGGVRNGFLRQLIAQQFPNETVELSDQAGVPASARAAAAAAVLATLSCDGVPGNLPSLTGASGGRLLGHFTPGDGRNWARIASWLAEQTGDYPRLNHAA
jgi:anhydro-N-acetylmuramic acid kinase